MLRAMDEGHVRIYWDLQANWEGTAMTSESHRIFKVLELLLDGACEGSLQVCSSGHSAPTPSGQAC